MAWPQVPASNRWDPDAPRHTPSGSRLAVPWIPEAPMYARQIVGEYPEPRIDLIQSGPIDPAERGETQIVPRGTFSDTPGAPVAPAGALSGGGRGLPDLSGAGERIMGGLGRAGELARRGIGELRSAAGAGLGRAGELAGQGLDAYGGRQLEAQLGYMTPRQAAQARLGDLGRAMMVAGGPRREPGHSFLTRFGEAGVAAGAMGRERRQELGLERYRQQALAQRQQEAMLDYAGKMGKLQAEAATAGQLTPSNVLSLSDDYRKSQEYFSDLTNAWTNVLSIAPDVVKAGDGIMPNTAAQQALVTLFQKILDPNSVVRGEEYDRIFTAAGGEERVRGYFAQLKSGEQLPPEIVDDMLATAYQLFSATRDVGIGREQAHREMLRGANVPPHLMGVGTPDVFGVYREDPFGGRKAGSYRAAMGRSRRSRGIGNPGGSGAWERARRALQAEGIKKPSDAQIRQVLNP